jgi:lactoylglutathione lyase
MKIRRIHHVAYRCKDARETVEWYGKYLNMDFVLAIAENEVPSTREPDPYMHIFLNAGSGNIVAFFELLATKARLEADGIEVVGPTDHTIFKSIYFFDPSGHRLELAANTGTPKMAKMLDEVKWEMLNEWARTKKAPQHARWMHDGSYAGE